MISYSTVQNHKKTGDTTTKYGHKGDYLISSRIYYLYISHILYTMYDNVFLLSYIVA